MIIYRKIVEFKNYISNYFRILHLNLLNKTIRVDYNSVIGKNCSIYSDNNSSLILNNVVIGEGVTIHSKRGGEILINDVYIGQNSILVSINKIEILPKTEIAEMVVIRDQDHIHNLTDLPIKEQSYATAPILIKENVWIGSKATILKGVTISKNSVVGAHSLVLSDIGESTVNVGIPSKKIK